MAVTVDNWKEQGQGNYWVKMGSSEFATAGKYIITVCAAVAADYNFIIEVRSSSIDDIRRKIDAKK